MQQDALDEAKRNFCADLKSIQPFLYKKYVDQFLAEFQGSEPQLLDQKKHLTALALQVTAGYQAFRKRMQGSLQKLFSQENIAYVDLSKQVESALNREFSHLLPEQTVLSPQDTEAVLVAMNTFFDGQAKEIEAVVEKTKQRNDVLREIDFFYKDFLKLLAPLAQFKDLRSLQQELIQQIEPVVLTRQMLIRVAPEDIEKKISDHKELMQAMFEKMGAITLDIKNRCFALERRCQDAKQTVKRRLFELFTTISPYQDLLPLFLEQREHLNKQLYVLVDQFYRGECLIDDFVVRCQDMAYEHDVMMIRNEIAHRSARLKDLRDTLYLLFRDLQSSRRGLELDATVISEKIYRDFVLLSRSLREVISQVEDPFKAFENATNKDEINHVFRQMWMKTEELQPKVKAQVDAVKKRLILKSQMLSEAFFKTADTLEDVIRELEGKRPIIVAQVQKDLATALKEVSGTNGQERLYAFIEGQIQVLESKYSFIKPFSFFMSVKESKLRRKLLLLAKNSEAKMESIHTFAKAMQYMKTFEEERVDTILEAFERAYMIEEEQCSDKALEEAYSHYLQRIERAFSLVLEEVLLDIGLLDIHALMDVDTERLKKILRFAVTKATRYVSELDHMAEELKQRNSQTELFKKSLTYICEHLASWAQKELKKDETVDVILEHLRLFCHELIHMKLLRARQSENIVASFFSIILQLEMLAKVVEQWLEETRGAKSKKWGVPWIAECHEIRREIARFELEKFQSKELKPLIDKVFSQIEQIVEVRECLANKEDPLHLQIIKQELTGELTRLDQLHEHKAAQFPFFYLPGDQRFFTA